MSALVFTVSLSERSARPVSVRWKTADDTARAGSDYLARTGTVTFRAGQTVIRITVPVRGDRTVEVDEEFRVTLSGARGASLATFSAIGTIRDDDLRRSPVVALARSGIAEVPPGGATLPTSRRRR